jgi:hypothetical protein
MLTSAENAVVVRVLKLLCVVPEDRSQKERNPYNLGI